MADSIEQLAERDIPPIKNDASAPVLMMLAFAKLTGGDRSLACVPLFGDGVSCGFPSPAQDYVENDFPLMTFASAIRKVPIWCEQRGIRCLMPGLKTVIY